MQKVDFMGQEHCLSAGGVPVYLYSNTICSQKCVIPFSSDFSYRAPPLMYRARQKLCRQGLE